MSDSLARAADLARIEFFLREQLPTLVPAPAVRGRPEVLPAALLWGAVCVSVLEPNPSQRSIWRLVSSSGLWGYGAVPVSAEAVRKRLEEQGPGVMEEMVRIVTEQLVASYPGDATLVPEVPGVYAVDGSTLDQVVKILDTDNPKAIPPLAGKIHAAFDLRRQLFARVIVTEDPLANEKVAAQTLIQSLPPGSLIVMDQGYIKFELLDWLTQHGYRFIIRYGKTFDEQHVLTAHPTVRDVLGFCGIYRADRTGELARQVTITLPTGTPRGYVTNVDDPTQLTPKAIATLYARRWDIEMAFDRLKNDLHLRRIWSTTFAMNLMQVWATLLIFQVASTMRMEIARRARVDVFDVSMTILLRDLPRYLHAGIDDVIGYIASRPKYGGIIRPSRRIRITVPDQLPVTPPPPTLSWQRPARYANKPRGNKPRTASPLTRN